jgi:hypothetical protein
MVDIEVLHMGMNLNQNLDYEGGDDLALGLPNDSSLVASSISMPTAPAPSESFATLSNLDVDATEVEWELLKAQLIQNHKFWIPHHKFSLP